MTRAERRQEGQLSARYQLRASFLDYVPQSSGHLIYDPVKNHFKHGEAVSDNDSAQQEDDDDDEEEESVKKTKQRFYLSGDQAWTESAIYWLCWFRYHWVDWSIIVDAMAFETNIRDCQLEYAQKAIEFTETKRHPRPWTAYDDGRLEKYASECKDWNEVAQKFVDRPSPDCTARWYLLKHPDLVSKEQIDKMDTTLIPHLVAYPEAVAACDQVMVSRLRAAKCRYDLDKINRRL